MEVNERGFSNKALEDFDLIDKAVDEKDQQAYATLMKRYKKAVYFMILKMIRDADDAEDLTMEQKHSKIYTGLKKTIPFQLGYFELPQTTPLISSEKRSSKP